jgi:hypothetical protein
MAMMEFHEYGGRWQAGTRPQVRELGERLIASADAGMAIFNQGN